VALRTSSGSRRRSSPLSSICLAVDAGARAQPRQRLDDQREAVGQVVAGAAVEPHAVAVLDSCSQASPVGGRGALVGRQGGTKPGGRGIAPPIKRECGARQTMAIGHLGDALDGYSETRRGLIEALLVEDEAAPGRRESVSIVRAGVLRP
jgi:hypothetical protein